MAQDNESRNPSAHGMILEEPTTPADGETETSTEITLSLSSEDPFLYEKVLKRTPKSQAKMFLEGRKHLRGCRVGMEGATSSAMEPHPACSLIPFGG